MLTRVRARGQAGPVRAPECLFSGLKLTFELRQSGYGMFTHTHARCNLPTPFSSVPRFLSHGTSSCSTATSEYCRSTALDLAPAAVAHGGATLGCSTTFTEL